MNTIASSANNFKIAGRYTVNHWKMLRDKLPIDEDANNKCWKKAFKIFKRRVDTRFINPINAILSMNAGKKGKGEGFSVVALQCVLIEFFEAFYQGRIYACKKNEDLLPNEYNKSRALFVSFLQTHPPFSNWFDSENNWANYFFEDVRCGLLHEAATKDRVVIRTEKEQDKCELIEKEENTDKVILYRTPFQKALENILKIMK